MFLKRKMNDSTNSYSDKILKIKEKISQADAVIIGAGAGFSTSAGFVYNGERFEKYFSDFRKKYGFSDMYSGGFYPYKTLEKHWGYWCRYIYINRYMDAPKPVYQNLHDLVKEKDYFVLTTNVDHCFQKAGFDKNRIFYTQGDYGLFQCSEPCHKETYDNEEAIKKMVLSQGSLTQHHFFNSLFIVIGFLMARFTTLKQTIISLCIKDSVFIEPGLLETMIHICRQYKIILLFHQIMQVLIYRFWRIHISINIDISAPVSPVLFQCFIWIEASRIHIRKSIFLSEI